MTTLLVKVLDEKATVPTLAYEGDLAYDLYACEEKWIFKDKLTTVRTGVALAASLGGMAVPIPLGLVIKDRSSMALKGVFTHGGVIDPGYRGELVVMLTTINPGAYWIRVGDKIAQIMPVSILTGCVKAVDILPNSERGDRGFGSTGR